MQAKKSLGQNFLTDKNKVLEIFRMLELNSDIPIIEVGPGKGALTDMIDEVSQNNLAIEIDSEMIEILENKNYKNTKIINSDILELDFKDLFSDYKEKHFISNLPYYISTKIIFMALGDETIKRISIMMQKELAERIFANNNTRKFGRITVALGSFYDVKGKINVKADSFTPKPNVDSIFIDLVKVDKGIKHNEISEYLYFVKCCFANKRKTLKNSLKNSEFPQIYEVMEYLEKNNFPSNIRSEQIEISTYISIWNKIKK